MSLYSPIRPIAVNIHNISDNTTPVNFYPFVANGQALKDKLRPQVFTLGFLR